jgi:hypothetical protein
VSLAAAAAAVVAVRGAAAILVVVVTLVAGANEGEDTHQRLTARGMQRRQMGKGAGKDPRTHRF